MENILKEIMKEGALVEPKAADKISKMGTGEQSELMERIRAEKPLILSEDFFENIIEVAELQEKKAFSMQDSAAALNSYFNVLQRLFEKKSRAVSISNASENAAVIGLVKNILPDGFELEDQTGAIKIVSRAHVEEEDVVMIFGKAANKTLYADLVEFPDLRERQPRKSPKQCEVIFGKHSEEADYSIVFGEKFSIAKSSLTVGRNPVVVKINNLLILVCNGADIKKNISPVEVLKKRRIPGALFAIVEPIDILLLRGPENSIEDYRGATAIAVNDKFFARINLKTREAKIESL